MVFGRGRAYPRSHWRCLSNPERQCPLYTRGGCDPLLTGLQLTLDMSRSDVAGHGAPAYSLLPLGGRWLEAGRRQRPDRLLGSC